jgi:hypothetical protein
MKLTIDTVEKTIEVENGVIISEFLKEIKKLLPDWKDYTINVKQDYTYIPYYPNWPTTPYNPPYDIWYDTTVAVGHVTYSNVN